MSLSFFKTVFRYWLQWTSPSDLFFMSWSHLFQQRKPSQNKVTHSLKLQRCLNSHGFQWETEPFNIFGFEPLRLFSSFPSPQVWFCVLSEHFGCNLSKDSPNGVYHWCLKLRPMGHFWPERPVIWPLVLPKGLDVDSQPVCGTHRMPLHTTWSAYSSYTATMYLLSWIQYMSWSS